ncbi:hypothetical protein BZA70DRAFT_269995 [Myxozyma melibiosi]|uniref:Uncharacterized protein n=1 Tax=Myxozyma melibiosi TaxID=54550 RepID=A0ABR1EXW5_9ASCO
MPRRHSRGLSLVLNRENTPGYDDLSSSPKSSPKVASPKRFEGGSSIQVLRITNEVSNTAPRSLRLLEECALQDTQGTVSTTTMVLPGRRSVSFSRKYSISSAGSESLEDSSIADNESIPDDSYEDLNAKLRMRARAENKELEAKRLAGSSLRHEYLVRLTTLPSANDGRIGFDDLSAFFWGLDYADMRQRGEFGRTVGYLPVRAVDMGIVIGIWLIAVLVYSCTRETSNREGFKPSVGQFQNLLDLQFADSSHVAEVAVKEKDRDTPRGSARLAGKITKSNIYLSAMAFSIFVLSRTIYIMIVIRHVLLVVWISVIAMKRAPGVGGIKMMLR